MTRRVPGAPRAPRVRAAPVLGAAVVAVVAVVITLSSAAAADDRPAAIEPDQPSRSGLRIGLRTGVAVPLGDAFSASGLLSDTITGYVPVRLDLGFRIERHFYVGIDAQLASIIPNGCDAGFRCSGSDSRFGAMVAYHLLPTRSFDPYLGVGIGYESMHVSRSFGGSSVDITARGFELVDVELGADVRPTRSVRVGPVVSTSVARFTQLTVNGTSTSDFDMSTHAWVMLGVRGAFDL